MVCFLVSQPYLPYTCISRNALHLFYKIEQNKSPDISQTQQDTELIDSMATDLSNRHPCLVDPLSRHPCIKISSRSKTVVWLFITILCYSVNFRSYFVICFRYAVFFLLLSVPKPVLLQVVILHISHTCELFFLALGVMCKLESNSKSDSDKDMRARDQIFLREKR